MRRLQSTLLRGSAIATARTLPSQALAAWGDENWGEMLWGLPASVPALERFGLGVLALGFSATAAWLLRKRRLALGLPVLLIAVASTATAEPNTFVNGTVADANEVNEAFSSLEAQIAALQAEFALTGGVPRFKACADGLTVADRETGLLWERKTTTGDVHNVITPYSWSSTDTAADGTAYTVFLADLNTAPGSAGHTDWRLPFISELQSILVGPGVTTVSTNVDPPDPAMGTNPTGQATTCSAPPCIDPDFAAVGGPTAWSGYWSASSSATNPGGAWGAFFGNGVVDDGFNKSADNFVRAVRAGSCGP